MTEVAPMEYWRAFLDATPAAVAILDRDLRYLEVSKRWLRSYRQENQSVIGRRHFEVFPDISDRWKQIHFRCLEGATESTEAESVITLDGHTEWMRWEIRPWYETDGQVGGIIIFSEDITERKQVEERLRISEARLRLAIQGPGVGIAEQDRDLRYSYVDTGLPDNVVRGSPIKTEWFIGKTDYQVYGEGHSFIAEKLQVIATGIGLHRELSFAVNGADALWDVWVEPRRDAAGEIVGVLCSFIDITDRRKTELQLRQSQKMEAIGTLTGGMAHDFNNLLAVIMGTIEEMRQLGKLDTEGEELAGAALSAAERGADLIHRLLAFTRQQPLARQRVEPNLLVAELAKILRRTLGEHIEIALDLTDDVWPIVVDAAQLEAALLNLATNARDAMPAGGHLTISTANRHLDEDYATRAPELSPGDFAMIQITDTGAGIPSALKHRIFEPFFTTKPPERGTGLGLSMVFGFIKQSGGHIDVYSEPGIGTTFRLYLPRSDAAATEVPVSETPAVAENAFGTGQTILVVEDDNDLRFVVVRQIMRLGYRVLEATTAAAALAVMECEPVDLLFTDVVMPGGTNGFELMRRVREQWPETKVLLTSGFPEGTPNGNVGAPSTTARVLAKPYLREELAQALQAAFRGD
jgi:two-component system cell cycle sensor histidine kinase/response regulator CckA